MAAELPPGFVLETTRPFASDRWLPAPAGGADPTPYPDFVSAPPQPTAALQQATASPHKAVGPAGLPPGFVLEEEPKISTARGLVSSAADIPIIAPIARQISGSLRAITAPEGTSQAPTFNERRRENVAKEERALEAFQAENPIASTAANVVGTGVAALPVAATAAGATVLGLGGRTLLGQAGRMGASGAGIGAADAVLRGHDPTVPAVLGGGLGVALPLAAKPIGAVVGKLTGSTAARAAEEVAAREAAARAAIAPEAVATENVRPPPDVSPVTPTEPTVAPVAASQPVPESVATLKAQQQQLVAGERPAQMFPGGVGELAMPDGMARAIMPNGDVFHYDPQALTRAQIAEASKAGRENDLLGLGPVNKTEAVARAQVGEPPVAVVERTPAGTEVRAAAGTPSTAPEQVAALEAGKSPGNTVGLENPNGVLAERAASAPASREAAIATEASNHPLVAGSGLTTNAVKEAAHNGYQSIDREGVRVSPDATLRIVSSLAAELRARGARPEYQPDVFLVLRRIAEREAQGGSTFGDLMADLQYLNGLRKGVPDKNYDTAGVAKRAIERFLGNVKQGDIIAGDPHKAVRVLQEANKNWSVYRSAEKLEKALTTGEFNASTSGNGKSNVDNNIRQAFKSVLKAIEDGKLHYPPDVKKAVRDVVMGSGKGLRTLAKFAPTGAVAVGADVLLGDHTGAGIPGALGLGLMGLAARGRVNAVTRARAQRAIEAMRAHAPAQQKFQQLLPQPPRRGLNAPFTFGSLAPSSSQQ